MNAREYAIEAHGSQMYGDKPFVYHLDMAVEVLREVWRDTYGPKAEPESDLEDALYLHDVLDDTNRTKKDLEALFGHYVAELAHLLSVPKDLPNRKARVNMTYFRVGGHATATLLKLCDRIANVRHTKAHNPDLFRMYKKEEQAFHDNLYRVGVWEKVWAKYREAFL